MPITGSCCIRCRTLSLLPACLRLVFPSSRLISSIVVSIVSSPLFDTVGRGVRRGASVSCLLGFILRSVPMSIAGSCRRSLTFPRSACLSARMRGDGVLISSVRDALRCSACQSDRLVPRLVHHPVDRVGSSPPSPRLSARWAGRMADAVRLRLRRAIVPRSDFAVCLVPVFACLGSFIAIYLIRMAAGGLSARRAVCLLTCSVVSVPCRPLVSSLPFHGLFDWCGSVPSP